MKKILIILAALALVLTTLMLGAKPASAGKVCDYTGVCGTIKHYSPDNGYDVSIIVRCKYGVSSSKRYVPEGRSSKSYCKDTDQVYVRINEEILCRHYDRNGRAYWYKQFDATGWHKINDAFNRSCILQRD